MEFIKTQIEGVWILEPKVYVDDRGYFMESFKASLFEKYIGNVNFIQENESCSSQGVIRGLHFQEEPFAQAKLVRVILGKVLDVAVDLRTSSATFSQYVAVELSEENKRQLFIPRGFAHGFYVMSDKAIFTYKIDNVYMPSAERSVRYNDPTLNIDWHIKPGDEVIVSSKDKAAPYLSQLSMSTFNKSSN